MLGLPKTEGGQLVGWIYDLKNPNGDNFIFFDTVKIMADNDAVKGILIDFNVDGIIIDKFANHQFNI